MTRNFIANGCFNDLLLFSKFLVVVALMSIPTEIPTQRRYLYNNIH